jgi:hypothetical protein
MTISIDSSLLTAYLNAKAGIPTSSQSSSATASGATIPAAVSTVPSSPTPPWSSYSTAARVDDLTHAVLSGGKFIDPNAAKLTAPGVNKATVANYNTLFSLYQGLNALNGLATQAGGKSVTAFDQARYQKAFTAGMQQVQSFLDATPFSGFDVAQGAVTTSVKSSIGAKTETDIYTSGTIYAGPANNPAPGLTGDVRFSVTAARGGTVIPVSFDLSDMGSTPRTVGNVVNYLNSQMKAQGVSTRFASVRTPGAAQTVTVGKRTVTLGVGPDTFALQIKGNSVEKLSFTPATSSPGIFISQNSGSSAGPSPDAQQQLLKFDGGSAPVAGAPGDGLTFQKALDANLSAVKATAASSDGSVYVLGSAKGTVAGQAIQGASDTALMKFDSAGHLLFTRTLGAEASATGLALAVSADGSQVAVTGTVQGKLDSTDGKVDAKTTDTLVTVFDKEGQEQWTQRAGAASANDQPAAVSFGADGTVYVAGQTSGALFAGGGSHGSSDGFLQAFSATKKPLYDGSGGYAYSPKTASTTQYGTSSVDRASGLLVSGSSVLIAGVENGHAVVRSYDVSSGKPVLSATRDLGDLQGGDVAGIALNSDGSIVVAGSTHNGALNAGTVTQPYGGTQKAAFVASLSANLQPSSTETLAYVGGGKDQTVSAVTASGGQVYITGTIATGVKTAGSTVVPLSDGYVTQLDPATGQTVWSRQYAGRGGVATPTSIAVSASGSSVLDALGLPSGAVDFSASDQVVANTSARAGDQFFVKSGQGGLPHAVTVAANDTYKTLGAKISRALGFQATVTTTTVAGVTQLQIKSLNSRTQIQLQAGPPGRDALASLGMSEALVTGDALTATSSAPGSTKHNAVPATNSLKAYYSLSLPSSLNLNDANGIKQAQAALQIALSTVRGIYNDMTKPPASAAAAQGTVPAYLTKQIAGYQAALDRLTAGGG